jgi:hypothetical protein
MSVAIMILKTMIIVRMMTTKIKKIMIKMMMTTIIKIKMRTVLVIINIYIYINYESDNNH